MPREMFCRYANDEGNMCSDKVGNLSILNWYIIDNVSIHSESIHRQFENSARQYWLANSANVAAGWRRAGLGLVRSSLYFLNAINKRALHSCLFCLSTVAQIMNYSVVAILQSNYIFCSKLAWKLAQNPDHHVNLSHYLSFFCILNDSSVTSASHDFSFFCFWLQLHLFTLEKLMNSKLCQTSIWHLRVQGILRNVWTMRSGWFNIRICQSVPRFIKQ